MLECIKLHQFHLYHQLIYRDFFGCFIMKSLFLSQVSVAIACESVEEGMHPLQSQNKCPFLFKVNSIKTNMGKTKTGARWL